MRKQTDGQTERANQTLETFLRHYINNTMDNWVELLPEAEIALSKRESATTKQTPVERVETRQVQNTTRPSEKAIRKATEIKALLGIEGLEKGDKTYLSIKNLRTTRPSKKLDHKKEGPFRIIGKPEPATREL